MAEVRDTFKADLRKLRIEVIENIRNGIPSEVDSDMLLVFVDLALYATYRLNYDEINQFIGERMVTIKNEIEVL